MLASLKSIFHRLLDDVNTQHYRYLYDEFDLKNRLVGLVGPRGAGKTTLLLQIIKNQLIGKQKVFYFSADHIYFENTKLYEFIEDLHLTEGIEIFFIDEIHKYKNWNQELKNLYDGFPKLRIIFSGSSSLDLVTGTHDLSRRAKMYSLPGLSLREYISFKTNKIIKPIPFQYLMKNYNELDAKLSTLPMLKGHFKEYMATGFYPFYFENPASYSEKILNIIDKTIYEDISHFYNLKTSNLHLFKKILIFLASIPPGETSIHNLAKNLAIDDKTLLSYLDILQRSGLVTLIFPAESGNVGLRRPTKIFLDNTNLYSVLETQLATKVELGTLREIFFLQSLKTAGVTAFHKKTGDFEVGPYIFEIGGKNKTRKQVKHLKNSFLIKDDILVSTKGEIPLLYFGFLY